MSEKVPVNEIFSSIQGEGVYIGERQIFVRLAGCNLECEYCDTQDKAFFEMSKEQVLDFIKSKLDFDFKLHKTVVFTGGEPLLHAKFIKDISSDLHKINLKIMLETNGTLPENLLEVIDFVDIISTDFKFQRYLRNEESWIPAFAGMTRDQKRFLLFLKDSKKDFYVKLVCDDKLAVQEFEAAIDLIKNIVPDVTIVLQPIFGLKYHEIFDEFTKIALKKFEKVLFLPQIHKFLDIK